MACRKMNQDVAYSRNTESGCKDLEEMGLNVLYYTGYRLDTESSLKYF